MFPYFWTLVIPYLAFDDAPIIWTGDLNFRIFNSGTESKDQLTNLLDTDDGKGFKESSKDTNFCPTCKINIEKRNVSTPEEIEKMCTENVCPMCKAIYEVNEKKVRTPSYCDRIIFKDDKTHLISS